MHVGAMGCIAISALPAGARVLLWAAVLKSLIDVLRAHGLRRGRRAIIGFRVDGSGLAAIRTAVDKTWRDVDWRLGYMVSWGVTLTVRAADGNGWRNLLIVHDAIDGEVFRQLRARLKVQPSGV